MPRGKKSDMPTAGDTADSGSGKGGSSGGGKKSGTKLPAVPKPRGGKGK